MNLPKFSVRYPVTVAMLMALIAILGYISFDKLGTDLLPSIYNPRIVVELQAGDRSPQEIEQRFARQLEGEVGTISKVVDVRSVCTLGRVRTTITFHWGTDMDFALLDVQKKIAHFESDPDVTRLTIARYDPQEEPIVIYALQRNAQEMDLDELRRIAENVIKRNLERLDGVARVQVFGGLKREVRVELNEYLLQAYNLTTAEVSNKITQSNANASGGKLEQDNTSYLIKGIGKYATVEEVTNTVVGYQTKAGDSGGTGDTTAIGVQQSASLYSPDKVPIYLRDVAKVSYAPEERTEIVRFSSNESVALYIYKEAQDNTVRVAGQVDETIAEMENELQGVTFNRVVNQAGFIENATGEVKTTAVIGIILAVLILYVFLRNIGVTIIISLAIPLSVMATFTLMFFQGYTLNIMTLGGLALGAGMLVDNAIVVIENIFRRRQTGDDAESAAVKGTSEVGVAIVAATLTTIIVFLPIVYVRGVAAELFREQAWVVAFSLLSSLLIAFMLIPTLAARFFAKKDSAFKERTLDLPFYNNLLSRALAHQKIVIVFAIWMLVMAGLLIPVVGSEFVPRSSENQVEIDLTMPPGTPLEKSAAIIAGAESQVSQLLQKKVQNIFSTVNVSSAQDVFTGNTEGGEHRARMTINLSTGKGRIFPDAALALLRPNLRIPETEIDFKIRETSLQNTIGIGGPPVIIEIRGDDFEFLRQISDNVAANLQDIESLNTIETSFASGRPEIKLTVNRLLAASFGLDVQQIGEHVKERLSGNVVSNFYSEGEERNIRVAYQNATLAELSDMPITTQDGAVIRLRDIANLNRSEGPREIQRHNQSRVAHVTAQMDIDVKLSQAIGSVNAVLEKVPVPSGYEIRFAGEEAERLESFDQLKFALLLSIVLVYMVLASLFESYLHPFTILLTLPLAGVGVVFAFLIAGEPLSIMAYIGVIMLAGIAVNDSIVLVDYINRLRTHGMARKEAILQAGRDRLRPILMTSATTILALAPLAIGIGEGARLRAPLAIAVIGGLVTSTLLTLVVIPVVYDVIDRVRERG
jgi:HAE1 family hydrophobic/amphiphilic exporter-1